MYFLSRLWLALVLLVSFTGCKSIQVSHVMHAPLTDCPPPPEPQCQPIMWKGVPLDTNRIPPYTDSHYYWSIRPVRGASTEYQEYALYIPRPEFGFLTRGTTSQQMLFRIRLLSADSLIVLDSTLLPEGYRSLGAITGSGGTLFSSAVLNGKRLSRIVFLPNSFQPPSFQLPSNIEKVHLNYDTTAWFGHPALSRDGKILIVATTQSSGFGGVDLWYSTRKPDGSWNSPRNLGPTVNTPCDELSPFITDENVLLFSSNGHSNIGGYDLFASPLTFHRDGILTAGPPENMLPPINTSFDELFPSVPDGISHTNVLYWSSNRHQNNFDLYIAERKERPKAPPPAIVEEPFSPATRLRGRVRTSTNTPVIGADVSVRHYKRRHIIAQTQTDPAGAFDVTVPTNQELELTAQSSTGFYDVKRLTIPPGDSIVHMTEEFVIPTILTLRINFPHDQARIPYEFVLDSNGFETSIRWTEELDRLAANILRYRDQIKRVVLVGHTDPNGTHQYNYDLGMRRVQFVIEELVKRGIPENMLEGMSAGETKLLPRRAGELRDQYFRRNRRVELSKVLQ